MTPEELLAFFNSLQSSSSSPYLRAESMNININITVDNRPVQANTGAGNIDLQIAQADCPDSPRQSQAELPNEGGEMMTELVDVGQVVEAVQSAVLTAGAKEVAGTAVKSTVAAGKKALGWLKEKLTGFYVQGLEHACEKPEEESRWTTLKAQLEGLLKEQPEFAEEFAAFLKEAMPEAVGDTITQKATVGDVSGKVNIVQIGKGSGNQINQS